MDKLTYEIIQQSDRLTTLPEIAKYHGLYGSYIRNEVTNSPLSGVYYYLTSDKSRIENLEDMDIYKMLIKQNLSDSVNVREHLFKVSEIASDIAFMDTFDANCMYLELVDYCFDIKKDTPEYLTKAELNSLQRINNRMEDKDLPQFVREEYEKLFKSYINDLDKKYNKPSIMDKLFKPAEPKVVIPLEELLNKTSNIRKMTCTKEELELIKETLKEYPFAVISEPQKKIYKGKGILDYKAFDKMKYSQELTKEDLKDMPDLETYTFCYPQIEEHLIGKILIRELEKDYSNYMTPDAFNYYCKGECMYYPVVLSDLERLNQLCELNNIKYSIDEGRYNEIDIGVPSILIRYEDFDKFREIKNFMIDEKTEERMITETQKDVLRISKATELFKAKVGL